MPTRNRSRKSSQLLTWFDHGQDQTWKRVWFCCRYLRPIVGQLLLGKGLDEYFCTTYIVWQPKNHFTTEFILLSGGLKLTYLFESCNSVNWTSWSVFSDELSRWTRSSQDNDTRGITFEWGFDNRVGNNFRPVLGDTSGRSEVVEVLKYDK